MTVPDVHWFEGMFLRPQHFQAARRHQVERGILSQKWDHRYDWGLHSMDLDRDALANYRLVIRNLKARLRDGTPVLVPEDASLPPLDLKPAFASADALTVFLAVPVLRLGQANVSTSVGVEGSRFIQATQEVEDENTGISPQVLQVRRLNLRLLLSNQDAAGYEVLPVARIEKSARADAVPQLDETYIPPVLSCDAWGPLAAGILQSIYDTVGRYLDNRAKQVVAHGVSWDSQSQGDRRLFEMVRVLNEGYALLGILVFAEGIHPLWAYAELVRLVGQLAIFDEKTRRPPELPRYDHDDLGRCFYGIKQYIHDLLGAGPDLQYFERAFVGAGLRMQVALEPSWLESVYEIYVGVRSQLTAEECIRLLTVPGQLDMKLGSSSRVARIFTDAMAGLRFTHSPRPPQMLPSAPGLIYFQVDRHVQQAEWDYACRELTLALRLNQLRVEGDMQGKQEVKVKIGGKSARLEFILYVVPKERTASS